MACDYHYRLTAKAKDELDRILHYIGEELENTKAATLLLDEIDKSMERACIFPESGMLVPNEFVLGPVIRKKIVNNYILYYTVDKEKKIIWVLRIVYGSWNQDEVMRGLSN